MKTHAIIVALLLACAVLITSCKESPRSDGPKYGITPSAPTATVYTFAVHPLHNPTKLLSVYQPLVDYLNSTITGATLVVEASRDYANFEEKYRDRTPGVLLPNPWQTLQAMKSGYSVIAMAGEAKEFKGIFIVRKTSGIRMPADLKGKAVSYPSPTALAACIIPQHYLHQHGIDIRKDIENRYVGSQESSIMNVYLQATAAGATWPPSWRAFQKDHPAEAAELKVLWETEPLINNSVMIRDDIPLMIREQIRAGLLSLHESDEGRAILARIETTRFYPAIDKDFDIVRAYVARFERDVRKVESK
ncbi:MAG TPA: PhnD/SsuA/transferrin family substrate-binding protein [Bacteroidota bacterium]|nr:PhnD/SsuA/transferrin family substrate-binding protein [Bacteroidota bacterium]